MNSLEIISHERIFVQSNESFIFLETFDRYIEMPAAIQFHTMMNSMVPNFNSVVQSALVNRKVLSYYTENLWFCNCNKRIKKSHLVETYVKSFPYEWSQWWILRTDEMFQIKFTNLISEVARGAMKLGSFNPQTVRLVCYNESFFNLQTLPNLSSEVFKLFNKSLH